MGTLIVLLVLLTLVALFLIGQYNRLVRLRNRFQNGFAQIDVQLKRRYDLIPNLVAVVKEYMRHERETLEAVVAARNEASRAEKRAAAMPGDPDAMRELLSADRTLTSSLTRLFAVVEAYPDLKANQNMAQLQEELASTENRVAFARQAYNDAVMEYNTSRESFPTVIVAGPFGFQEAPRWLVEAEEERVAPRVAF